MQFRKLSVLAFSAFLCCGSITQAVAQQNPRVNQPDLRTISTLLTCSPLKRIGVDNAAGGKTFRLSTGTNAGECHLVNSTLAGCSLDGKNVAQANCSDGCTSTARSGTCERIN
jgi:hypothetical protein